MVEETGWGIELKLTKSKLKEVILEEMNEAQREVGGYYLMKQLKDLAHDAKSNGEKKLHKGLMYLHSRINQSYRDIDLSSEDVLDLLNDPRGRKYSKDIPTWMIDDLFERKVNERFKGKPYDYAGAGTSKKWGRNYKPGDDLSIWGNEYDDVKLKNDEMMVWDKKKNKMVKIKKKEYKKFKKRYESINEAIKMSIDDLLKNKKVKEIMKRLGIKISDAKSTAKIVNHFMRNPTDLKAIGA